jgi:hypothetical protein
VAKAYAVDRRRRGALLVEVEAAYALAQAAQAAYDELLNGALNEPDCDLGALPCDDCGCSGAALVHEGSLVGMVLCAACRGARYDHAWVEYEFESLLQRTRQAGVCDA